MNKRIKHIVLYLFCIIGLIQNLSAQVYPVQVVPTVLSPYSSKLSDYSNAMVNRINLQLISTDVLMNRREVDLRLKIQGNGITAQSSVILNGARPIYLNGGEIQSLSSAELATYFRYDNLQGISTTQYSNPLPDGIYTICFQVFDKLTQKVLSSSGCATIYLMLNDPPILNLPSNKEEIAISDFPNIIFSWTPRQLNATNVSYSFELKEILDPTMDPSFAFEVSRSLYKQEDLRSTTLVYDVSKPNLLPGKRYAWRVRAISTSGLGENSVFKNNGYSQVYSFTYTSSCSAPRFLLSEQQSNNRVKILWQGENSQQRYHVQYRKAGVNNAEWFDQHTVNTQTMLSNLEPGFTYEFRVGASCSTTSYGVEPSYTYSSIQTFSIDAKNNATAYNCGIVPDLKVSNMQPLGGLVINETFMAGDFPVKVLDVSGSNGVFSGKGYIKVPYLFDTKIAVEFLNVEINTDYQLVRGMVETTYDPNWSSVEFIDNLVDTNQKEEKVPFEIAGLPEGIKVNPNTGEIVVTGKEGDTLTFPGDKDTVITDSKNNVYYVDKEGKVSGPTEQAEGGKPSPANTDGVDKNGEVKEFTAKGISITFESEMLFDKVVYEKALTKDYKKVGRNFLPFKGVINGKEGSVIAKVNLTDSSIALESLVFKTSAGAKIDATRIANTNDFELTVKGMQSNAIEEVQASIKQGEKYKVAGAFKLVHMNTHTVELRLVPTSSSIDLNKVSTSIKEIYEQVGVRVNIDIKPVFDISAYLENNQLPTVKDDKLSTYSDAQQRLFRGYQDTTSLDKAYYLFVTDKASSTGVGGYMRLNGQYGFVFNASNDKEIGRTAAHEFGHGAFRLEHPFVEYKKDLKEGKTNSLMDYQTTSTSFIYTNWRQINDPKLKFYTFQGQSEGALWGEVWINPLGEPFKLENTNKDLIYLNGGTVKGSVAGYFVDVKGKDRQFFKWNKSKNAYTLNGDDNGSKDTQYYALQKPKDDDLINLYLEDGGCGKDKNYRATYKYVKAHFTVTDGIKFSDSNNIKYVGNIICESGTKTNEQFFGEVTFPSIKDVQLVTSEDISQERINDLVNAVNNAVAKNISAYSYDKHTDKSKLGRIAIQDNISTTAEQLFKIDHKLVYLSEYTQNLQSKQLNVYVVYHKVDYFIKSGWNALAKKVYESSNLKDNNAALILIPYFDFTKEHAIVTTNVEHYMPGLYSKGLQIETSAIGKLPSTEYRATEGIANPYKGISIATTIDFINKVYNQTYKPAEIFYGLRYADGSISSEHQLIQEYKPGANAIKFVLLKEHQYFNLINNLSKPQQTYTVRTANGPDTRINENYYSELLIYQIKKAALEDEARANIENSSTWNNIDSNKIIDFKEKFLNKDLARGYIYEYAYQSKINQFVSDLGVVYKGVTGQVPELYETDHTYNKENWAIIDDAVYGTLDVVSLPLSVVGGDVITDALGFAYATVRLDGVNSAIYGSAIIIPAYSGGIGHIVLKNTDDLVVVFKGFKYVKEGNKVVKVSGTALNETVLTFFKIKANKNLISEQEVKEFYNLVTAGKLDNGAISNILQEADEVKRIQAIKALKTTAQADLLSTLKNVKLKNKGITNLNRLDNWSADELLALDNYINKYGNDLINELKTPELFDAVERFVKQPDVNPWEIIKDLDNQQIENLITQRIGKSQFFKEVVGKGKVFEAMVTSKIKTINPPFADLIADGYTHLNQIHLLRTGSSNKIIADDLFVKAVEDSRGRTYYRAVLSDSKLNVGSPWTDNQKSELINIFKNDTSKEFIEFEVRSADTYLEDLIKDKNFRDNKKIRIYREDVYKIISDGEQIKIPPIQMDNNSFK